MTIVPPPHALLQKMDAYWRANLTLTSLYIRKHGVDMPEVRNWKWRAATSAPSEDSAGERPITWKS